MMRLKKKNGVSKIILIILTIIILGAIGISYAYYTDSLQFFESASTGSLDVCFEDGSKLKDIGTISIIKEKEFIFDKDKNIDDISREFVIVDNSTMPIKASIIKNNNTVSVIYEDNKVELCFSDFRSQKPGTYDITIQIVFDQFNGGGNGFWKDVLTINGTVIVEEDPDVKDKTAAVKTVTGSAIKKSNLEDSDKPIPDKTEPEAAVKDSKVEDKGAAAIDPTQAVIDTTSPAIDNTSVENTPIILPEEPAAESKVAPETTLEEPKVEGKSESFSEKTSDEIVEDGQKQKNEIITETKDESTILK